MLNHLALADIAAPASGYYFLLFPAILFAYYVICRFKANRVPKRGNMVAQYEPPAGISPGVARYIQTGGSDGTTLAATLAQLAARNVISIQPQGSSYKLQLLAESEPVAPEEAALVKALFDHELPVKPYLFTAPALDIAVTMKAQGMGFQSGGAGVAVAAQTAESPRKEAVIDPRGNVAPLLDGIQDAFRKNLAGVYFRWNFKFVFAGMAATFLWAMGTALVVDSPNAPSLFLTLWLLMFTSIAGVVFGGFLTARPKQMSARQRVGLFVVPLLFFVLPGFLIAKFALPSAQFFVLAVLLSVLLNSAFIVLMRAPTEEGGRVLRQLAGFREFLIRVEQDRLERMNTPSEKAELMNRFLPYAIALEVKEGWGDTMASAFSNAIVER